MSKMTKSKLAMLALAGLTAGASGTAVAADCMTVASKGGIEVFNVDDSNYWFKIGGRLAVDQVWYDGSDANRSGFPSGSRLRYARLSFKGGVGDSWIYKLDVDFKDVPGVANWTSFGEAFLGYLACRNLWFAVGQISVPFGLENYASATDMPFMELSLPSQAFAPDFSIGLFGQWYGEMFTVAATVYHPGAGTVQGYAAGGLVGVATSTSGFSPNPTPTYLGGLLPPPPISFGGLPGSDPLGAGIRVTFSPVHNDCTVYHAGVSARYVDLHDTQNAFQFITGMEARSRQAPVLFTGIPFNSSNSYNVWGFELATRCGPFMAAGEYMLAHVDRPAFIPPYDASLFHDGQMNPRYPGGNLNYHGYYLMASYVLTGESKDYDFKTGTFGRVHPRCKYGAWEILARYSFVNLLDGELYPSSSNSFLGTVYRPSLDTSRDMVGGAHGTTIGLTWWVSDNVRFMGNYIRADLPIDNDLNIFALRAQVNW